ncbi:hypothetical protein PG993_011256 [Apiospora rasikravindrae]|uniref:FAD-binding PCMH-type domain-containing protein n=1 Tax=Apiospora rasikravindrae TaxID=990691 RepID=A0ABR1SDS3_9PEZI
MATATTHPFINELLERAISVVRTAVVAASRHGVQVQARSGGHSYTSFSHGGRDGAVVIDLRNLQDVELRKDTHSGRNGPWIAKVGGGVRLGNLALDLYYKKKLALSHGTCPSVGIGGHFTHGGYGHCSRAWGLAMDQIVAMDVVLADGSLVYTDAGVHEDIFYAMRGAAESFGIVVNFYLRTQPAPKETIRWTYHFGDLIGDTGGAGCGLCHKLVQDDSVVDRNLSFGVNLSAKRFEISGVYLGSVETYAYTIEPAILRCFPKAPRECSEWEVLNWLYTLRSLAGDGLFTDDSCQERGNFFAKSVTVPEPGLSAAALTSYFEHIEAISAPYFLEEGEEDNVAGWWAIIALYGGADSQINNVSRHSEAAYPHRDLLWVAQHYGFFDEFKPFPDSGLKLIEDLNEAMTRHMDGRCKAYINYTDSSLSREQAHALYYGDEVLARLRAIKKRVDPGNVFAHPQSIE